MLLFFFLRRDRIFSLQVANPDEAELLASGRRAAQSLVPYERFTSPTYGPIWAMFLGTLDRLGIPLTLPTAHILSAVISATTCIVAAAALSRRLEKSITILLLCPLVLFWANGFDHADYWSLSTELLPMLVLVSGAAISFCGANRLWLVLFGASLVGLGAWSKYQFGLLALAALTGIVLVLRQSGQGWFRSLFFVGLAANSWMIGLYLIAAAQGVPWSFLTESVSITIQYISGGGLGNNSRSNIGIRLAAIATSVVNLFPVIPLLVFAIQRKASTSNAQGESYHQEVLKWKVSAILVLAATGITLLGTYPIYPHYNYILLSGSLVAIMVRSRDWRGKPVVSDENENRPTWSLWGRTQIFLLALSAAIVSPSVIGNPSLQPTISISEVLNSTSGRWERAFDDSGQPLSKFCPPGSTALVWGWASEVYAFYDLKPASRYVAPAGLIEGAEQIVDLNIDSAPLRQRLTEELTASPPECVIDATGPSFFPGYGPSESMASQLPELWKQLSMRSSEYVFYWDRVNPIRVLIKRELGSAFVQKGRNS